MFAKEEDDTMDIGPLVFDQDDLDEEVVDGNVGAVLVVHKSCFIPRGTEDDWLQTNIFQSTSNINGNVCTFMIDVGSYEHIIS